MRRHAAKRKRLDVRRGAGGHPDLASGLFILRHIGKHLARHRNFCHGATASAVVLQRFNVAHRRQFVGCEKFSGMVKFFARRVRAFLIHRTYLKLTGICRKFFLARSDFFKLKAAYQLRYRDAGLLDGQRDDRDHICQHQDDVLRNLCLGNDPHAAKKRIHQYAAQTQKNAQLESDAREIRRDQADPINLRDKISKGTKDGCHQADQCGR